jgi:hypothetical protein
MRRIMKLLLEIVGIVLLLVVVVVVGRILYLNFAFPNHALALFSSMKKEDLGAPYTAICEPYRRSITR